MKNLIFGIGLIICSACAKIEEPTSQISNEEVIKFTTNLDTDTYNVVDTLPLNINITSKLPTSGVTYSIVTTWVDNSKQIFKLDTTLNSGTLSMKIPGLKNAGNYSVTITLSSKSSSTNKANKTISVVNNPLGRFQGYKVDELLKSKDEINYWRDCGVMWDIIMHKFNILPNGQVSSNFMSQAITGDFNNDGYVDVFNPGTGTFAGIPVDYCQWLIWNPQTKTFENRRLLNDKSIKSFGGGQNRSIAYDINKDGYTDVVVLDSGDDGLNYDGPRPLQPIRMVLSDGKGGYDLKELNNITPNYMYNHSGDIGDLNNDGNIDLVVATGNTVYISWGISTYPYFSNKVSYFSVDYFNPNLVTDNGFGESVPQAAGGVRQIYIYDINKDGWNDIVEGGSEQSAKVDTYLFFDQKHRILLNQGKGRFNQKGIVQLPFYFDDLFNKKGYFTNHDFRVIDYNNDGLNDIITSSSIEYDNFDFMIYIQNLDGTFKIEKSKFVFNINANRRIKGSIPGYYKTWLVLHDFNNDGLKDISYIDNINFDGELKYKTVFIRNGNQFIETDFYQFDEYAKSIKP